MCVALLPRAAPADVHRLCDDQRAQPARPGDFSLPFTAFHCLSLPFVEFSLPFVDFSPPFVDRSLPFTYLSHTQSGIYTIDVTASSNPELSGCSVDNCAGCGSEDVCTEQQAPGCNWDAEVNECVAGQKELIGVPLGSSQLRPASPVTSMTSVVGLFQFRCGKTTSFTAGTHEWVIPAGVNTIAVKAWGGGGGGGAGNGMWASGGGGGGFSQQQMSVSPGQVISATVGGGGLGNMKESGGACGNNDGSAAAGGESFITIDGGASLLFSGGGGGGGCVAVGYAGGAGGAPAVTLTGASSTPNPRS